MGKLELPPPLLAPPPSAPSCTASPFQWARRWRLSKTSFNFKGVKRCSAGNRGSAIPKQLLFGRVERLRLTHCSWVGASPRHGAPLGAAAGTAEHKLQRQGGSGRGSSPVTLKHFLFLFHFLAEQPSPGLLTPIFNPLQTPLLYQTLSLGLGFSAFDLLIGFHPL